MRYTLSFLLTITPLLAVPDMVVRSRLDTSNFLQAGEVPEALSSEATLNQVSLSADSFQLSYVMGQSFLEYGTPYEFRQSTGSQGTITTPSFADDVLFNGWNGNPGVYAELYPAGFGTPMGIAQSSRQEIIDSGLAFRYRFLLAGPDEDGTEVVNLFASSENDENNPWFTDDDRQTVKDQIGVLREALALDPLNRRLQDALLDVHYDLAVAEMQFVRTELVALGRLRLGLDAPGDGFIIDREIESYERMVEQTKVVLELYGDLLSFDMAGFRPSDLYQQNILSQGEDLSQGATFGYYLFQNLVPLRSQVESAFMSSGASTDLIDFGSAVSPPMAYKDYEALLGIIGRYIQFQADLSRLRGLRRAETEAGSDVTLARKGLQLAQEAIDFSVVLNQMFSHIDFDEAALSDTGVRGAREAVNVASSSTTSVRGFLNGTTNLLGLDPDFLLLVPARDGKFDSYDVLRDRITEQGGPLERALTALGDPTNPSDGGGAVQAYTTFKETVDAVRAELFNLDLEYANRFAQITGYDYNEEFSEWDGTHPNPDNSSELSQVDLTIESLERQSNTLTELRDEINNSIKEADKAVSLSEEITQRIEDARVDYFDKSEEVFDLLAIIKAEAAASDAAFNGIVGTVAATVPGTGGVVGAAGLTNAVAQANGAAGEVMGQQALDRLAVILQSEIASADLPLIEQESRLASLQATRDLISNSFEQEEVKASLAQAISERARLLNEVTRSTANLIARRGDIGSRYASDPIHFIRSETAILQADAAFRSAQLWTFYTCRALEYKWQRRFAFASQGDVTLGISFDISNILSARNALELEAVMARMQEFDLLRVTNTTLMNSTSVISFKNDLLSVNPANPNHSLNIGESDLRVAENGQVIDQQEHFLRQILASESPNTPGTYLIEFDTTQLEHLPLFFPGPDFITDPDNPRAGTYRNKIVSIAVNVVAREGTPGVGEEPDINGLIGRMIYGGNTLARTRIPVCPRTRRNPLARETFIENGVTKVRNVETGEVLGELDNFGRVVVDASADPPVFLKDDEDMDDVVPFGVAQDYPNDFIVAPFRYWQDNDFDGSFDLFGTLNVDNMKFSQSTRSYNNSSIVRNVIAEEVEGQQGFLNEALKERSVAATRWILQLSGVDPVNIEDIELIINHVSTPQPQLKKCD